MRRFVIGLLIVAAVLAGVDVGGRVWGGLWVGDRVREALGLSRRPSVSFGGVLFTPQVVSGHITSTTLQSENVVIGGVPFSSARLSLRNVTFRPGDLILHHRGRIDVEGGAGVFGMTAPDLEEALRAHGQDVWVRFSGEQVRLSGEGFQGETMSATPSLEGADLVISGTFSEPVRFRLPALGQGIQYGGVVVAGDEILVSVRVTRARIAARVT